MFTQKEKQILLELIFNEQTKHLIVNNKYGSDEYNILEGLKMKIRESEDAK